MSPARELLVFPAGMTLAEMVATAVPDPAAWPGLTLTIGGDVIPHAAWHLVRPKPGTRWQLALLPRGGGALRMILIAAVVALAIATTVATGGALAPFWGATAAGVAGSLAGAAVSIGGMLAVNALIPPPQLAVASAKNAGTNYSVTGASNSAALWAPVPRVLGRVRTTPPLGCEAVTSIRGTTSKYLNLVVCWGVGPLQVDDIRIGDTPLDVFDDVQHEFEPGTPGVASALSLYPTIQHMASFSAQITKDVGWVTRTTPLGVDTASVELSMPSGMIGYGKKTGDRFHMVVDYEVEWSVSDADTWTHFPGGDPWRVDQKTETAIILALDVTFAARGQYDIRVRRLTDDLALDETQKRDAGYWTALKATTNDPPIRRKGLCLSAFRIKGTAQLSGQITNLSGVPYSIAPDYDAPTGTWVTRPTANPASLFRMWCEGPGTRDAKRFDLPSLEAWHAFCTAQGFKCNLIVDGERTWQDVMAVIFAAGRASWTYATGAYGAAIDQPRPSVGLYTPRNLTSFSAKHLWPIRPHGIRVPFFNERQNWAADERLVFYDGYDETNATRYERFDLQGITDPDLIHRFGRYHLAAAKLQPERFEIGTDWEHVAHQRGDRVDLAHDVMLVSVGAGRVRGVELRSFTAPRGLLPEASPVAAVRPRAALVEALLSPAPLVPAVGVTPAGTLSGTAMDVGPAALVPAGVPSASVVGTPSVAGTPAVVAVSLAAGWSVAAVEVSPPSMAATPPGVPSGTTTGTPVATRSVSLVTPPGVQPTGTVGTPTATPGRATVTVPGAQSGTVVGVPGVELAAILTDERFSTSPGTRYGLRIRHADMSLDLFEVVPDAPLTDRLTVPAGVSPSRAPDVGDLVTLGELGRETLDCVILTVRPGKDMTATLALVPYNEAIYSSDTETIPDWDPRVSWPAGSRFPIILRCRSDEVVLARDADGSLHLRIVVSLYDDGTRPLWDITHVEVGWAPSEGAGTQRVVSAPNDADEIDIDGVEADIEYAIRARYRLLSGAPGQWSPVTLHKVEGASFPPPDVANLYLAGDRVAWPWTAPPDFAGFRLAYVSTAGTPWEQATPITDTLYSTAYVLLDELPDDAVELLVKGETTAGVQSRNAGRIALAGVARPRYHPVFTDELPSHGWGLGAEGGVLTGGEIAAGTLRAVDQSRWAMPRAARWATPGTGRWAAPVFSLVEWDFQYACPGDIREGDRLRLVLDVASGSWQATFKWLNDVQSEYPDDAPPPDAILDAPDWLPFGHFLTGLGARPYVPWRNGLRPVAGEAITFKVYGLSVGGVRQTLTGARVIVECAETLESHAPVQILAGGTVLVPDQAFRLIAYVHATLIGPTSAYKVEVTSALPSGIGLAAYDLTGQRTDTLANVLIAGVGVG